MCMVVAEVEERSPIGFQVAEEVPAVSQQLETWLTQTYHFCENHQLQTYDSTVPSVHIEVGVHQIECKSAVERVMAEKTGFEHDGDVTHLENIWMSPMVERGGVLAPVGANNSTDQQGRMLLLSLSWSLKRAPAVIEYVRRAPNTGREVVGKVPAGIIAMVFRLSESGSTPEERNEFAERVVAEERSGRFWPEPPLGRRRSFEDWVKGMLQYAELDGQLMSALETAVFAWVERNEREEQKRKAEARKGWVEPKWVDPKSISSSYVKVEVPKLGLF